VGTSNSDRVTATAGMGTRPPMREKRVRARHSPQGGVLNLWQISVFHSPWRGITASDRPRLARLPSVWRLGNLWPLAVLLAKT